MMGSILSTEVVFQSNRHMHIRSMGSEDNQLQFSTLIALPMLSNGGLKSIGCSANACSF